MFAIHHTRNVEGRISDVVGSIGLVKRVKTDNVRVRSQAVSHKVPISHIFVSQIILVCIDGRVSIEALFGAHVHPEAHIETVFNEWVPIFVRPVPKVRHVMTNVHLFVKGFQHLVHQTINAGGVLSGFSCVEIRHSFATHRTRKGILMSIN